MQVLDLVGHTAHFQPPLAEVPLHLEGFQLLEEQLHLGGNCLMPLIEVPAVVNFSHIPPIILGQGFKALPQHSKGRGAASEGSKELSWEPSWHTVFSPSVCGGIEIGDSG
jgi:hypothetical protein